MTQPAADITPDEVISRQRNRQVTALTVVILVLAGLVWLSRSAGQQEQKFEPVPLVGGTTDSPAFKKEDVAQIEIWSGKDKPMVLVRTDGGWRVPGRYNAPADRNDIDALLTKLFDAKRLGRASTEDTSKYVQYQLADDDAAHLRLQSEAGKELLHLLIGRSEDNARDFVRLANDDPKGIFELAGPGGAWDTLYSRLQLDVGGKPEPKRWLDLSAFRVIETGTRVDRLTIQDGDRGFEFRNDPLAENKWDVTLPRAGEGESTNIQAVVNALANLAAIDVAGRDVDAGSLGLADSRRWVTLEYLQESRPVKATLTFGTVKDGNVAVQLKSSNQGTLLYWVAEYVLARVFRKTGDFIRRVDLGLMPIGVDVDRIRVADGDKILEADKRVIAGSLKDWRITLPSEGKGDRFAISNLLTTLNSQRGLKFNDPADHVAVGVAPSVSRRFVEIGWAEKGEKKEGEESPAEIRKTGALYFGKTEQGEIAVLVRVTDKEDALFWLDEEVVNELFVDPVEYMNVKVRHILITWKDKFEGAMPKDPQRTEAQARDLVQKILDRLAAGEDFVKLQVEFNEDGVADKVYEVSRDAGLVKPFADLSFRLGLDKWDQVETQFGIHIIKRVE